MYIYENDENDVKTWHPLDVVRKVRKVQWKHKPTTVIHARVRVVFIWCRS